MGIYRDLKERKHVSNKRSTKKKKRDEIHVKWAVAREKKEENRLCIAWRGNEQFAFMRHDVVVW